MRDESDRDIENVEFYAKEEMCKTPRFLCVNKEVLKRRQGVNGGLMPPAYGTITFFPPRMYKPLDGRSTGVPCSV